MSTLEEVKGWRAIKHQADIEDLMRLFGNFHDACVREVHAVTGHYVEEDLRMTVDWKATVHILVQRQYRQPSAIELRFDGAT